MRTEPLTVKQIERNFNLALQEAIDLGNGNANAESGIDPQTYQAIIAVSKSYPNPDPALIRNARKEFAKQLDRTHQREEAARWEKYPD